MASARKRKDCFISFLFVLPLLALFLVFLLILLSITLSSAFMTGMESAQKKVFVGFANYAKLWADPVMQKTFRNFVIIAISTTVIQSALGLMLASFFIRKIKLSGLYKILFYLPAICTSTIVGTVFSKFRNKPWLLECDPAGTSSGFSLSAMACNTEDRTCMSFCS